MKVATKRGTTVIYNYRKPHQDRYLVHNLKYSCCCSCCDDSNSTIGLLAYVKTSLKFYETEAWCQIILDKFIHLVEYLDRNP